LTSSKRWLFVSKSKIPPKGIIALAQIAQAIGDDIELFRFHDDFIITKKMNYTASVYSLSKVALSKT